MSSPLSSMTCVRAEGRACWIRIEPWQALTLPHSDTFALATLLEVFGGLVQLGGQVLWAADIAGPLKAAIETDSGLGCVDAMLRMCEQPRAMAALAARYVACRGYRDVAGFTLPAALRPNADGLYVATPWWRDPRERDEARGRLSDELAAWYEQFHAHEEEGGPPPTLVRPAATIVMEVTRPDWLAHLRAGMAWDGYCYDDQAPALP